MTAEELVKRFGMSAHAEKGAYIEKHYEHTDGRAASGSIYYYVGADELTEFHVIDCDEYWCYTEGAPLEVWLVSPEGITVKNLGVEENCEPFVYVPKGTVFASRHAADSNGGTFLTCITVPRFDPAGFQLVPKEELLKNHPEAEEFYK